MNAFELIARWHTKAKRLPAIYTKEKIKKIIEEATSGDYNHLVATLKNN